MEKQVAAQGYMQNITLMGTVQGQDCVVIAYFFHNCQKHKAQRRKNLLGLIYSNRAVNCFHQAFIRFLIKSTLLEDVLRISIVLILDTLNMLFI